MNRYGGGERERLRNVSSKLREILAEHADGLVALTRNHTTASRKR